MGKRRGFLFGLAGTLAAPHVADAQATKIYRLGWLGVTSPRSETYNIAFTARLAELGFVEGRNLVVEYRVAEGRVERLPSIAIELSARNCDVFLATGPEATLVALKQAGRDTPIVVLANDYDLVSTGHIASMARPGGRITGVSQPQTQLPGKRLELLKELLPQSRLVGILADSATKEQLAAAQAAAHRLGLSLHVIEFKSVPYDYEAGFAELGRVRVDSLLSLTSGFFVNARRRIADLAISHRIPSMFGNYLWAEIGGLLSYGVNFSDAYRLAADKVNMILKGARPGEIPVEEPSGLELIVNLKTARALGATIPPSILARADRTIE